MFRWVVILNQESTLYFLENKPEFPLNRDDKDRRTNLGEKEGVGWAITHP